MRGADRGAIIAASSSRKNATIGEADAARYFVSASSHAKYSARPAAKGIATISGVR